MAAIIWTIGAAPNQPQPAISREDLLNRATSYDIDRWGDGLIDTIYAYQGNTLIGTSTAHYVPDPSASVANAPIRLESVDGYLYPEIAADYQEWLNMPQTVIGTVAITGPVTISGAVTITSGTVTFTNTSINVGTVTSITAGTITFTNTTIGISGTPNINIASISGGVTFTIANATIAVTQSGGWIFTGSVTITSGAVTISTASGTNILIDLLQQSSYIDRQSTISNGTVATNWNSTQNNSNIAEGKFFPRGMRGFLSAINVYSQDSDATGGTITVYISPNPNLAPITSAAVTVPNGGAGAFRAATFNLMWNYDSMFIYLITSVANVNYGRIQTSIDRYAETIVGSTAQWAFQNNGYGLCLTVSMSGETVGDIPISGTVNNVSLPNTSSTATLGSVTVPTGVETNVVVINGSGVVTRISLYCTSTAVLFNIYVDGVEINTSALFAGAGLTASALNVSGYTASTPQVQLTLFTSTASYISMQIPFEFKQSIKITALQNSGVSQTVQAGITANLIL